MLEEGIKIKCWDEEGADGTIELNLGDGDLDVPRVLHVCIPMLDAQKTLSIFLPDMERVLRRLKLD